MFLFVYLVVISFMNSHSVFSNYVSPNNQLSHNVFGLPILTTIKTTTEMNLAEKKKTSPEFGLPILTTASKNTKTNSNQAFISFATERPITTPTIPDDIEFIPGFGSVNDIKIGKTKNGRIIVKESSEIVYKIKKSGTAKKFLQMYNSNKPVAVLVDDTRDSRTDAAIFFRDVFSLKPDIGINFLLMIFNSSGVSSVLATSQTDLESFYTVLSKNNTTESSYLGPRKANSNGTAAFYAILTAAQRLPSYSGILVFVKEKISEEFIVHHALNATIEKYIRVYTVWGGLYPTLYDEERVLKEFSQYTGGEFFVDSKKDLSKHYYQQFLLDTYNYMGASIILAKRKIRGPVTLSFPIDSDVSGIHIDITPSISQGSLITPNEHAIDILQSEKVAAYSAGSFSISHTELYELHLNISTTRETGVWRLKLENAREKYNVTVFAYSKLTAMAALVTGIFDLLFAKGNKTNGKKKHIMKLGVTGHVSVINNISLVSNDGNTELDTSEYTNKWEKYVVESTENVPTNKKKEIDVELSKLPVQPFYAIIYGIDGQGNQFSRLTYVKNSYSNDIFPQPPLTIDVASGSELYTYPGRQSEIRFEVTNNGNAAMAVRFSCKDEQSILYRMEPYSKIISPRETAIVRVTLNAWKQGNYQDQITFRATGAEIVEKRVLVDVGNGLTKMDDKREPDLDYTFTTSCIEKFSCEENTWTIEIKAKDTESGLLQLTSQPKGIYFPYGFTTGTREEVTGYYSESCCNPDIQIIAVDRMDNHRIIHANAYNAPLSAGSIAAIVLGILILIAIIVLIVFCVRKCCKKRQSYVLPVYGGRKF